MRSYSTPEVEVYLHLGKRVGNKKMITKNSNNTISFSIFSQFPELLCVMSTRKLGNLNVGKSPIENAEPLLKEYGLKLDQLVVMNQVHGVNVGVVTVNSGNTIISQTDALMTKAKNLFLSVNTADCVPFFFYDPVKKNVATAHAGWKGTLGKIAEHVVKKLQALGSDPQNIYVAIGPHIGGCCYDVSLERAELFRQQFHGTSVAFFSENKWYLDLGLANKIQLKESGVLPEHIDTPITCTSCQNDVFFSYRKENKNTYGEMLGIIGVRG